MKSAISDKRQEHADRLPRRAAEAAEAPECQVAELTFIAHEDQDADQRRAERRDGDAGEEHRGGRGASVARADGVEQRGRDQGAEKSHGGERIGTDDAGKVATSGAPSTIIATAASAAPDETPTRPGSASGLRKRLCMTQPAVASAAPIRNEKAARGNRISRTTSASRSSACAPPESVVPITERARAGMNPVAPDEMERSSAPRTSTTRPDEHGSGEAAAVAGRLRKVSATVGPACASVIGRRRTSRSRRGGKRGKVQVRIERGGEIARRVRGARAEAEQIEAVHGDHIAGLAGRRFRERRVGNDIRHRDAGSGPLALALHDDDRVWRRFKHCLGADGLVAGEAGERVLSSREAENRIRRRVPRPTP